MNPMSCMSSSTTEDSYNFVDEVKKVFEVIHVVDTEQVKLVAYKLKRISGTWFE